MNDPAVISPVTWLFILSYYAASLGFHKWGAGAGYWRKNGPVDIATSILWVIVTLFLIACLIDLSVRNQMSIGLLLQYYAFFLFLFAFVYNIVEWHFPGQIRPLDPGWLGELQCLIMSVEILTSSPYTSSRPRRPASEFIAAIQSLLGIGFVAVFVALAVARMTAH